MINYRMWEKKLRRAIEEESELLKSYTFRISKKTYRNLVVDRAIFAFVLVLICIIIYISESYGVLYVKGQKMMIIGIITIVLLLIILEGFYRVKIVYPKMFFKYEQGSFSYGDGNNVFKFQSKDISMFGFYYYNRSSQWRIRIDLKNTDHIIYMHILLFEDPETIMRLLNRYTK